MKRIVILVLKIILLTAIMIIAVAISSSIVGVRHTSQSSGNLLTPVIFYSILNTLILTIFIINSKARRFKLIGITFIIFWGVQYFMTQIETLYFNSAVKMPLVEVMKVVISGALSAIIFSSFAGLILGKSKKELATIVSENPIKLSFIKLLPNVAILSVNYVLIYFLFGYFVAWQFPDLRYYYTGSTAILNVFQHYTNQFQKDPVMPLFQFLRGLLWSGLAVIIIHSLGIKTWKTYIISGLLFSILITTPLIFSNPYMPGPVRLGHSFELSTSMFTFGLLSVFILRKKVGGRRIGSVE